MKKHAIKLVIAILTFCIGTAGSYVWTWTSWQIQPAADIERPHAVLHGTTVRILPFGATFKIPESWIKPNPLIAGERNLYLSGRDLIDLPWNNGGDSEDAQVMDAVLPLAQCAAHFGDRGWGNYFWGDLQGRVYVADLTPTEIAEAIETGGLQEARSVFANAELTSENHGVWQKLTLTVDDATADFILVKQLDFYYRPAAGKTVVFVFLHADCYGPTIRQILDSFDCSECGAN
jgi:hypothetical protein